MNPQYEQSAATPEAKQPVISRDLLMQIAEEMEATNRPFGSSDDYTEQDAIDLGLPPPRQLNFLMKFVRRMIGTPFVPRWMYDAAKDARSEEERIRIISGTMLACAIRGREMGFKALESTEVFWKAPDGRLGLYAKPMTAMIYKSGGKIEHIEESDERHVTKGTRKDGNTYTASFSHEDVVRAGLWDKDRSNHKKYPRNMLKWRTLSDLFNTLFPDLSGNAGPVYTAEELQAEFEAKREDSRSNRTSAPEPENPYAPKIKAAAVPAEKLSPTLDMTSEANETRAEGPDTSARAEAGSSAPGQQPGGTGDAAAAAPPPSDSGKGATERSAPAAPATEKVTPISKPKMDPRVPELLGQVEKLLPPKQKKKIVEEYLRGYFNVTDLKPVMLDPRMPDAAALLVALCGDWRVQLIGDPHAYGVAAAAGWAKLSDFVKDWPEDSRQLAQAMALQYADTGGEGLYDYFAVLDLDSLAHPELDAFLKVVWRIGIGKPATALRECGAIKETVEGWGLDLKTCEPAEIIARIGDLAAPPFDPTNSETTEDEPVFDLFEHGGSSEIK